VDGCFVVARMLLSSYNGNCYDVVAGCYEVARVLWIVAMQLL